MKIGRKIQKNLEARQLGWKQLYNNLINKSGWSDSRIRAAFKVPGSRSARK